MTDCCTNSTRLLGWSTSHTLWKWKYQKNWDKNTIKSKSIYIYANWLPGEVDVVVVVVVGVVVIEVVGLAVFEVVVVIEVVVAAVIVVIYQGIHICWLAN